MRGKCTGAYVCSYVCSRSVWLEKGERSTSYFLNLGKKQIIRLTRYKMKVEQNIPETTTEIIDVLKNVYDKLYTGNDIDIVDTQNHLNNIDCEKITNDKKKICDDIPTLNKCKTAVENIKNNISPVQNGLPVEFYKVFWDDIKDINMSL